MSTFLALEVSLRMVSAVRPVIAILSKRSKYLADQLERSVASVPLGLGEGRNSRKGHQPARYQESLASASEVMTILRTAKALGHVTQSQISEAMEATDRTNAIIYRLLHPKSR